jgi:hypothetical protein
MDPTSVRSHSGFLFTIGGCPISWVSKLQNETAMSTMEAEYVAMSTAVKDLIPLKRVVEAVAIGLDLGDELIATLKSDVWEDNAGALTLGKLELPRYTPRSKHYAIKYHWFSEFVQNGEVVLNKIDTKFKLADLLTKSLSDEHFVRLRKLLMGW